MFRLTFAPHLSSRPRKSMWRLVLVAVATTFPVLTLTACGPTVTMPNVVGMRLDEAHQMLEDLGFENFEDADVIGAKETIFRDRNWVVVSQDPAVGATEVDTGTKPKLSVGNQDDKSVLKRISADSPFAIEAAKKAADQKEKKKEDAAERKSAKAAAAKKASKDARSYATKIDQSFGRTVPDLVKLYVENADAVQAAGGGSVVAAQNAIAARDAFDKLLSSLGALDVDAPSSLENVKGLGDVKSRL